jgi:MFS family permease
VFLGGLLTQELDWRWVLFINVPIAAAAALLAFRSVTNPSGSGRPRLDLTGALLVTAGLFSLVYAAVGTDQHPWGSPQTLVPLGLAALLLAAFVVFEQRLAAAPLVRFGLLRNRKLAGANIVIVFIASAQLGAFYLASLYLQDTLDYSPLRTGLAFLPFSVAVIAGTFAAGKLVPRHGPRMPLAAGLVIAAGGLGWFAQLNPHGSFVAESSPPCSSANHAAEPPRLRQPPPRPLVIMPPHRFPDDQDPVSGRARLSYEVAEQLFKHWSGSATLHRLRHSPLTCGRPAAGRALRGIRSACR